MPSASVSTVSNLHAAAYVSSGVSSATAGEVRLTSLRFLFSSIREEAGACRRFSTYSLPSYTSAAFCAFVVVLCCVCSSMRLWSWCQCSPLLWLH